MHPCMAREKRDPMTVLSDYELSFAYPGFLRRLAAGLVDLIILFLVLMGLLSMFGLDASAARSVFQDVVLQTLVLWFYSAALESSVRQATLGKIALGLLVTDLEGRPVSFGRASIRAIGKIVTLMLFGIGYLSVPFTRRRQALHDLISGCQVIRDMKH